MTPEQRSLRASVASHASWARTTDRSARVLNGNRALDRRIAHDYGIPDNLPAAEYSRRLASARAAYFKSLAMRSAKVRARRKRGAA